MKRKKLLFLGIDTSTVDAIKYAKSKNIYTIVTDFNSPEAKPEKKAADEYWMIDVSDFEALKNRCMEEGITNIFAGNHEFCLDQCKRLCEELTLYCFVFKIITYFYGKKENLFMSGSHER